MLRVPIASTAPTLGRPVYRAQAVGRAGRSGFVLPHALKWVHDRLRTMFGTDERNWHATCVVGNQGRIGIAVAAADSARAVVVARRYADTEAVKAGNQLGVHDPEFTG